MTTQQDHTTQPPRPRTGDDAPAAAADAELHPALDVPVEEAGHTRAGLDKVVFGVSAAIAVAFLVWGFVSTSSLAKVSGDSLTWTMANTGWLFVLTSSGFVVFVLWLALSRFGNITAGP